MNDTAHDFAGWEPAAVDRFDRGGRQRVWVRDYESSV
jgi:hypothetical protein